MNLSVRRMSAIFQKDLKDVLRNYAVSFSALMPIILAFIYGRMESLSIDGHYLVINLTMVVVGAFVQCCLIAEEKEKNTLRGLMLSPATTTEIIGGKSLLTFVSTMAVIALCAYLTSYNPKNIYIIVAALIVSSLFFIGLGTLLGLFSKSVMEASVLAMPFMFIFGFGSILTEFAEKYPILKVAEYLPNTQLVIIATRVEDGVSLPEILPNFGIIVGWIVVTFLIVKIVFKKRMKD